MISKKHNMVIAMSSQIIAPDACCRTDGSFLRTGMGFVDSIFLLPQCLCSCGDVLKVRTQIQSRTCSELVAEHPYGNLHRLVFPYQQSCFDWSQHRKHHLRYHSSGINDDLRLRFPCAKDEA